MDEIIMSMKGLKKRYDMVMALDDISLDIKRGEVHAVCGENGAGKSTLIKLLMGAEHPTSGSFEINGISYKKLNPKQSMKIGLAAIYQEFSLIPYLSVVDNIYFGRELKKKNGMLDSATMAREARKLCENMGVELDINSKVQHLGVAYQQIVEILKALSRNSQIIIMDEPTTPLTISESGLFFSMIERLKREQVTIIYISHRLEEIFEIADRLTVLCDGRHVVTCNVAEVTRQQLISYMVGREISQDYPKSGKEPGKTVFNADRLNNDVLHDVSLEVKRGEILGIGGLVGAGRTELANAIFGADKLTGGTMEFNGKAYHPKSPKSAIKAGIGLIPENRKSQGIILSMSVGDNIVFSVIEKCTRFLAILKAKENRYIQKFISSLNIKTPSHGQLIRNLSGGNQQKAVLAKMLATECDLMIFDEPTRGIDVGAKREIYNLMCQLVEQGKSIIMISSEMPELIGMADRIIVMSGGRKAGELQKAEFTQERILELASDSIAK